MKKIEIEKWETHCPECDGARNVFVSDNLFGWNMICPQCFGIGKFTWTERAKGEGIYLPKGEIVGNIKKESKGNWNYINQWDRKE